MWNFRPQKNFFWTIIIWFIWRIIFALFKHSFSVRFKEEFYLAFFMRWARHYDRSKIFSELRYSVIRKESFIPFNVLLSVSRLLHFGILSGRASYNFLEIVSYECWKWIPKLLKVLFLKDLSHFKDNEIYF